MSLRILMSVTKDKKKEIISEYARNSNDFGSSEVQIAILSERIKNLTEHFKLHTKDKHSSRGLETIINRRKKLLDYLKINEKEKYTDIITKLGIRK